jgi:hypothetical protein
MRTPRSKVTDLLNVGDQDCKRGRQLSAHSKPNYGDREAFSAKTTDFRRSIAASGLPFIKAAIMSATSLVGQLATSLPPLVSSTTRWKPLASSSRTAISRA